MANPPPLRSGECKNTLRGSGRRAGDRSWRWDWWQSCRSYLLDFCVDFLFPNPDTQEIWCNVVLDGWSRIWEAGWLESHLWSDTPLSGEDQESESRLSAAASPLSPPPRCARLRRRLPRPRRSRFLGDQDWVWETISSLFVSKEKEENMNKPVVEDGTTLTSSPDPLLQPKKQCQSDPPHHPHQNHPQWNHPYIINHSQWMSYSYLANSSLYSVMVSACWRNCNRFSWVCFLNPLQKQKM